MLLNNFLVKWITVCSEPDNRLVDTLLTLTLQSRTCRFSPCFSNLYVRFRILCTCSCYIKRLNCDGVETETRPLSAW